MPNLDFEICCSCGRTLHATVDVHRDVIITIDPCDDCLSDKFDEGYFNGKTDSAAEKYNEGYDEGFDAGESAGWEKGHEDGIREERERYSDE